MSSRAIFLPLSLALVALPMGSTAVAKTDAAKVEKKEKKPSINPYTELQKGNKYASWNNSGGFKRAVKHYKRVLQADPVGFPYAYLNLGEVNKALKRCPAAVLAFQGYLAVSDPSDGASAKQARRGIRECSAADWASLQVSARPAEGLEILVDGHLLARDKDLSPVVIAPGSYELVVRATDYIPVTETIKVTRGADGEGLARTFELERKTFFGKVNVNVLHEGKPLEGVTITLEPRELDKANANASSVSMSANAESGSSLATGKYYLSVEVDGYRRWIRNIYVTRDSEQTVEVNLVRALPDSLRPSEPATP